MIKTKLSVAIATLGTMAATGVAAQDAVPGPAVEEVIVTGSRIARDPLSSTGPITIMDSEEISRSGVGTIDDLLNQIPSMGTQGINANDNNGGAGMAFVELRNLGTERTLVLVNGRRYVSSSEGTGAAVDMNNIPVDMIDRVEVLTDGASAVYGSDAVAGVINVVMKDSFEGMRLSARGGATEAGGGENSEVSFTFGNEGTRGSFVGNISHNQRDEIGYYDRDWANSVSTTTPWGNITVPYGNPDNPGYTIGDDLNLAEGQAPYDIGQHMWLSGAMERTSAIFSGTYSLNSAVEAYGEASYTHKVTNQQMATQPLSITVDSVEGFDPTQHLDQSIREQLEQEFINSGGEGNWWDGLTLKARPIAAGHRESEQESDTYRFLGGLRGDLANGWGWDIFASYGNNQAEDTMYNALNRANMEEVFAGETDIDPNFGEGGFSPAMLDYVSYADIGETEYEITNIGASLTGEFDSIQFQGGTLGFASGIEYREETGYFTPSQATQSGDTFGNRNEATSGGFEVTEVYTEFNLPILEGKKFAEELTMDAALRYSDYSTFGGKGTGKLGLVYAPVEDLRFRSSFSTAYRAPGIYELYSGLAQSYEYLLDPCDTSDKNEKGPGQYCGDLVSNGHIQGSEQLPTNVGGNQDLEPEETETLTAGLVWTPSFVDGLSFTVDYYDIQIDNAIVNPDMQRVLDDCHRLDLQSACELITRDSAGNVVDVEGALMNTGKVDTRGIDFGIDHILNFNAGQLALSAQATRLLEYKETNQENGKVDDWLGYIDLNSGLYTKWRGLANATWYGNDWDTGLKVRYIGSGDGEYVGRIPSQTYLDLNAGWDVSGQLRLSAGVDNVADEDPETTYGDQYWNTSFDFQGRYAWAGVSYQF